MKRVGLVVHGGRAAAVEAARALATRLKERDVAVFAVDGDVSGIDAKVSTGLPEDLDLVVVLGGDGTLLRAVHLVGPGPAVFGVNFGHLGFLTATALREPDALLDAMSGDLRIEPRRLLEIEGLDGETYALNDLVVEKSVAGRAVRLDLTIGEVRFVTWTTDAVIIATPTGSTAYSFSAGGPLVSPKVDCMVVTPVSPHGLFDRSLVVAGTDVVTLRISELGTPANASVDGRASQELAPGATLRIRLAKEPARLARTDDVAFWDLVRDKLRVEAP